MLGDLRIMTITYKDEIDGIDWQQMKSILNEDDFDNGRSPEQLQASFANSYAFSIAYDSEKIIGTARVLSDGVCNAYIVDVWTYTPYRHQGIARHMIHDLMNRLQGQHIYLFTEEDTVPFYETLGFQEQGIGLSIVVGEWLVANPKNITQLKTAGRQK
jgi:ribosomal protein S18 acetylase RimI-like enzyme